jgi:hypothetical protein
MMIILGAHYLPFMFLYGMRMFGALSALLVALGIWLAHGGFATGAWVTAVVLLAFAVAGLVLAAREGLLPARAA